MINQERIDTLNEIVAGIRLTFRNAPRDYTIILLLNLLYATGPILILFVSKYVIDNIDQYKANTEDAMKFIAITAAVYLSLNIITDSFQTVMGLYMDNLRDRVRFFIKGDIIRHIASIKDISLFENPERLDTLLLTEESVKKMWELNASFIRFFIGIAGLIPSLIILFRLDWWMPIMVLVFTVPAIFAQGAIEDESWFVEKSNAETTRRNKIIEENFTTQKNYKDVKLYGAEKQFLEEWESNYEGIIDRMTRVRSRGVRKTILWSTVSSLGAGAPYVFVIFYYINGGLSLGDLSLYSGLIFQLRRSLEQSIFQGLEVYDSALSIKPYWEIKSFTDSIINRFGSMPQSKSPRLSFRNVNFSYPEGNRDVLSSINIDFPHDSMTVIVGENGAGKTTLAKLIARFYDPTQGSIYLDDIDIRDIDINQYRMYITAVFQDFGRFEDTIRKNIYLEDSSEDIEQILKNINMDHITNDLPQGYNTIISKQFKDGTDLSGGQWQRIAIGRAMGRLEQANIVLLDEPTSALDPETEHEVFQMFRAMCKGKIGIIISHRLSLCRYADNIIVLDNGTVLQSGSHATLMLQKDSRYYNMFNTQAKSYQESN